MKLSVIVPVYNEIKTIEQIIQKIINVDLEKEIIIVDDGSTDGSKEYLESLKKQNLQGINIFFHEKNQGKGVAIRTGIEQVGGQMVVVQDADLEYDPNDYLRLVAPIENGEYKVVYGSRNLAIEMPGRKLYNLGSIFLSKLANFLYGINITDEATCYKVIDTEVLKKIDLKCRRFEFCPEVTAKLSKQKYKILEIPIYYSPRSRESGKKIKLSDGLSAAWTLIKYRFIN